MKTNELIRLFSSRETLPVDVNDLLPVLHENGADADIEFIGVDLDPDILQGKIKIWHAREGVYGEPKRLANIYYHRGHTIDWQRLICAKELMHLLDPAGAHTASIEDIDVLATQIGLPEYMQDATRDGFATNVDRLAEFRAAAILLPYRAREHLLPPLNDGRLTLGDIAIMADIPLRYVALVMSPGWNYIHELLTAE